MGSISRGTKARRRDVVMSAHNAPSESNSDIPTFLSGLTQAIGLEASGN